MKQKHIVFSILLLVLAGVAIGKASQLSFGTLEQPQAGFWPLLLALILTLVAMIHLVNSIQGKVTEETPFFAYSGGWKKFVAVVVAMLLFGLLFEKLGYLVSVFLLICFLLRVVEPMKWRLVVTIALLTTGLTYFVLGWLLDFILPAGLLGS